MRFSLPILVSSIQSLPLSRNYLAQWAILFFLLLCLPTCYAQPNHKAKEAFNKGNFDKAIRMYSKDLRETTKENTAYNSLLYNLAEAYRLSGNYKMADSLHVMVDYTKTSYWGYALTLLQQYRADKCLKFVKYNLKFDALHPELNLIVAACELVRTKVDESKVLLKTIPLPQKKERLFIPGFIIGTQEEKEIIDRFNEYAGKRKEAAALPGTIYPITLSGIGLKGKKTQNFSLSNAEKIGFSITPDYFTHLYNPAYYSVYKATSKSKTLLDPSKEWPDSLKSLSHFKEYPFYENKEVVKQAWISSDKNTIVFSSNKLKGEGGYDLFISHLSSSGWTRPMNLGSRVNTFYNEIAPFISPNGILYFSSNGREGLGGYDIYSFDLTNIDALESENLPKPFNSAFDDYGLLYHEQTGFGAFASTRPNGIFANQLFQFENKIVNCDAVYIFKDYPEITTRNSSPKYCVDFDMLPLQDRLPKGAIYTWMMGDGKKNKGLKFTYCYAKPGLYKTRLLTYNPTKKIMDTTKFTKEIVVSEKDFLLMEYSSKDKTATFTTTSSLCRKCENVSYYWDFGDGSYGCGFAVKHLYKTYGAYTVRLIMNYKKDKSNRSLNCYDRIKIEETP